LASSSEQPESTHTLPRPELNPLLNPLLAENMGRWAEVYFTAPLDKREEAVLELLHELESGEGARGNSPASGSVLKTVPDVEVRATMTASEQGSIARENSRECPSCGHENPVTHQFCGMCGATVESSARAAVAAGVSGPGAAIGSEDHSRKTQSDGAPEDDNEREEYYQSSTNPNELSLFRSLRGRDGDYDLDYEPPASRPYRYYIGAVLAIVIGVMAYMAWRSEQITQTHETPASPPAVTDTGAPSAESSKQNTDTAAPATVQRETPPAAESAPPATKTPPVAANSSEPPKKDASAKTPAAGPARAATPEPSASGNGGEELAMAQRYLSGNNGRARDSTEASRWLWKSIAKHNGEATLLLSDLYLRGDGVSKNCDQARVLLDSAARRGIAGAGERLRNLRAFGCQ